MDARDPNRGTALAGGSDFRSRSQDARIKLQSDPVGAMQRVAWLNGVAGTEELDVYPTANGTWCYAEVSGVRSCGFPPDRPELPVMYGLESSWGEATGGTETRLIVQAANSVARIRVTTMDGKDMSFDLQDPPPAVPPGSRFAYVSVGNSPYLGLTVIGYDAAGNELGRRDGPGMAAPRGSGWAVGLGVREWSAVAWWLEPGTRNRMSHGEGAGTRPRTACSRARLNRGPLERRGAAG